ncbi:MAG: hypothetical protein E7613_00610 [Ruminococcaceae bacterium]|nr:hypothetical protein [Oscillospiraceae bacterium]
MNKFNPNFYLDAKDDAEMIQKAVDAAKECGEKVVIPRHNERTGKDIWMLPRAVKLYTGTTICLDNCHIRQADESFDNIFKNLFARTDEGRLIENRQYDIHIYGLGNAVLDGGNHNGLVERNANRDGRPVTLVNSPLHFVNCERICVENLRIVNSRYWGMCFHYCSSGRVSNIHFMSVGNCPNQDGIDLRTGCNSFVIENISGFTQDDTIALTCLKDSARYDIEGMDDSIHNVIIRNITSFTLCAQIRLLNNYGRKIYNILIENVQNFAEYDPCDERSNSLPLRIPMSKNYYIDSETTSAMPGGEYWAMFTPDRYWTAASIRLGENHYSDPNDPNSAAKLGQMYNITVRNVQSRARTPIYIARALCDSVIENVQVFGKSPIAVYFDKGEYDNIKLRDISFNRNAFHDPAYDNIKEEDWCGFNSRSVVYFKKAKATNIFADGITTAVDSPAVFAGSGDVSISARDICSRNGDIPVSKGDIKVKVL